MKSAMCCGNLVVRQHVVESVSKLISNLLDLQLLPVDLVLNVVDLLGELSDAHLSVLEPVLGGLVLPLDGKDLLLELLFPLHSLLSGSLKGLHVLTDQLQLFLNALQLALSELSPLDGPLQLILLHAKLPAQFIQLLLVVGSHLGGGPQVLVQLLKGDFIVHAGALDGLDLLEDVVSLLGGSGELGDGASKVLLRLLGLLLHEHDPTGKRTDIALHLPVHFVLFLQGLSRLLELVTGLIKVNLKAVDFFSEVPDVDVGLVGAPVGLLGLVLEALDDGVEAVGLRLEGLHLLPDGVHGCVSAGCWSGWSQWLSLTPM